MANQNGEQNNRYAAFVLVILASIAIMVMYVEAMAFPSLPMVMEDYGLTPEDYALASWIVTIYLVVGAVSIPVFGKLGDIYGKKKMLLIAMTIYSVMVTVTGFSRDISDSIYVMIAFRGFQGLAMSMFPLAFSIIRDEFPRDRIAIAQGVISAMFGVGTAVGFVLGGWVTDNLGWQWTYHTVAPFAFIALAVVAFKIKESPVRLKAKVDFIGAAMLGLTMVFFLVGVTETRNRSWGDPMIVALLVASAVMLLSFVFWLPRAKDPLVRPALMKKKAIAYTNITGFMIGFALFTSNQTIAALAGFNFGLDATDIGILMLPMSVVTLIIGPTVGFIVRKYGPKWPMTFGMVLSILGFALLYQWHATQLEVMLGVTVMGGGSGFAMVGSINMIIISTPRLETGISTAMNMIIRTSGSVVGPALAAVIISDYSHPIPGTGVMVPDDQAYQIIFIMASAFMAVGVLFSLLLPNKKALPELEKTGPSST
ncbi:MAG TPA: MFS transporter [Thermoplasmata archaeon]|jgi:MFS family permease